MNTATDPSQNLLVRRPLLSFFGLTYLLMWGFALLVLLLGIDLSNLPVAILIGFLGVSTPTIAAVIVTGALKGRAGIRRLLGKFLAYRIAARWVLVALLPFLLAPAAACIYLLGGGSVSPSNEGLSAAFLVSLLALVLNAAGEEGGWRGFALPHLLEKHRPAAASLILAIIWYIWHLPLYLASGQFTGTDFLIFLLVSAVMLIALTFLMSWIYLNTPSSLIPIVIFHASFNASNSLVVRALAPAQLLPFYVIVAVVYVVIAAIIWRTSASVRQQAGATGQPRGTTLPRQ